MAACQLIGAAHQTQLGGVHPRIIPRVVTIPAVEKEGPHDAEGAEQLERVLPGHQLERLVNQVRRERPAPARAHPGDALRAHALFLRQPCGECFRQVWKAARFTRAEQRARYRE